MKEAEVMNNFGCALCSSPPAFNLLQRSCLILTSALLQVQLFWSLRLGRSQHQYSSILHRGRKHRLAPSNFDKYQWVDTGERKWVCTCLPCTPSFPRASKWRWKVEKEKFLCSFLEQDLKWCDLTSAGVMELMRVGVIWSGVLLADYWSGIRLCLSAMFVLIIQKHWSVTGELSAPSCPLLMCSPRCSLGLTDTI